MLDDSHNKHLKTFKKKWHGFVWKQGALKVMVDDHFHYIKLLSRGSIPHFHKDPNGSSKAAVSRVRKQQHEEQQEEQ